MIEQYKVEAKWVNEEGGEESERFEILANTRELAAEKVETELKAFLKGISEVRTVVYES